MNIGNIYAIHGKIETEVLSVVVSQFNPKAKCESMDDVRDNIQQMVARMEQAVNGFPGMDLFVSPECSLQNDDGGVMRIILDMDGPEVQTLKEKCKELDIWGIFNPWVKSPDDPNTIQNRAILVNNKGETVLDYQKMNPWIPNEGTEAGQTMKVADGPKGSRIAILICADGDYPEMWREAAVMGANVIVRISHYMTPYIKAMEITNKAGAYCNQVYVVSCMAAGMDNFYNQFGESAIYGPDGNEIIKAPNGIPYVIKADLYPGIIDHMRKYAVHSNPMFSYRNRGASNPADGGAGKVDMPYTAYKY